MISVFTSHVVTIHIPKDGATDIVFIKDNEVHKINAMVLQSILTQVERFTSTGSAIDAFWIAADEHEKKHQKVSRPD